MQRRILIAGFLFLVPFRRANAEDKSVSAKNQEQERSQSTLPENIVLNVDRMMCASCTSRVKKTIGSHPGVQDVTVNLTDHEARFTCQPSKGCDQKKILKDLSKIGYPSKLIEEKK